MFPLIGNSTLYDPKISGYFVLLTVIFRLLKFVKSLRKIALCLGGGQKQVVCRELPEGRVFVFLKKFRARRKEGPKGSFKEKKTHLLATPYILLTIPFNLYSVWPTFIFLYNVIIFICSGEN